MTSLKTVGLTISVMLALFTYPLIPFQAQADVLSDIDRAADLGENAPDSLVKSIHEKIAENPASVTRALLQKIKAPKISDNRLATYIWALGLTRNPNAVDAIIQVADQRTSEVVQGNCFRSLATIGGEKSGAFLMTTLNKTTDKEMRFNILNFLGQMQYQPALPKTLEIMELDPQEYYWQSIFVFSKMGDAAVPFLLGKINDSNKNIRWNAINVLGQWLIAPEAAEPLRQRYWKEKDRGIRCMILSSLERTTPNPSAIKQFSEEVVAREKDKELVQFAQETINNMQAMEKHISAFKSKKKVSPESFQREYKKIYDSSGKEGDYEVLSTASSPEDEPTLKKLRERILQRNSDESFYDYQKVNEIIMMNRIIKTKQ